MDFRYSVAMTNGSNFINIASEFLQYLMQTLIEYAVQYCRCVITIKPKNVPLERLIE